MRTHRWLIVMLIKWALFCALSAHANAPTEMPENVQQPMPVGVSLAVLDVQGIKENISTLLATVELRQTWSDARLAFDPIKQGADRIIYTDKDAYKFLDEHWYPHIVMTNQISTTGAPVIGVEVHPDGSVVLISTITAGFYIRSEYSDFPFDRQAFPIDIASSRYNRSQLTLSHNSDEKARSVIEHSVHLAQWSLTGLTAERTTRIGWDGTSFEHLSIKILAKRNTLQYAPQIFLPFLFIMIAPLIVVVLKGENLLQKATMLSGAALATIALQFTIAASFPEVVLTDNVVSRMFWLGYVFLLIMLLFVVTIYNTAIKLFTTPHFVEEVCVQLGWIPALIFLVLLLGNVLSPVLRHIFS